MELKLYILTANIQQIKGIQSPKFSRDKLTLATRNHGYTDKTHLPGLETLDFSLVHVGGLGSFSSELSR